MQTPRLIASALVGYRQRCELQQQISVSQARLIAGLNRWPKDKYLPSMEELIAPAKPKGRQSTTDMLAAFQDMQAAGAPIRIKKVA